ncbi:ABC transporter ATP-binding protein [Marinicrinis sediminis]|uniref:ABC transporter ATP-binding protein n=1 Tax=Marinicrinis sediminis TaxID=1652465 RepID=A0ABW5RE72_9BACL
MTEKDQTAVLTVRNLKKKIGDKWIIKGLDFEVYGGEVFGFLGPNGAGKTTTIRMLVDLIKPTEGKVLVAGKDVHKQHDHAMMQIGSIVENPELYMYLTGWENLEHFANMIPGVSEQRIQEVVDIVGLDLRIHDKVKTYSLGMRQRLGIAQALLNEPKLLILDEPTNGLDPQGIKEMREFIRGLAATGLSIFVSSHLLSEIQMMCDRVAIIRAGEVIAVGQVEQLLEESTSRVDWKLEPFERGWELLEGTEHIEMLSAEDLDEADASGQTIHTRMRAEDVPAMNRRLQEAGVDVFAIETKKPTLEQLFLRLTEGDKIG